MPAATPSGYGRSLPETSARRRGIEKATPSRPPSAQTAVVCQNGKPLQCPISTRPGSASTTLHRVPAAEAWVWTMLFSRMPAPPISRNAPIEIMAAGIDDENVIPVFRPM
jgi:hypothetical protein